MNDEQFEHLMQDAAESYNRPPRAPLDEIWASIDAEVFRQATPIRRRASLATNAWLRMAAVLVVGVAIGRFSHRVNSVATVEAPVATMQDDADAYQLTTERYLGQTAALLGQLPKQLKDGRADTAFVSRASKSLTDLRLLMDSPAASNPRLRSLFEDLELVLVQVVQMPDHGSATDARMIRQAIEQRDVMPRLRDAVAETPNF